MFSATDYAQSRVDRQQEQRLFLRGVLSQPTEAQAKDLFFKWPHKLPRAVKKDISFELRSRWRALREAATEKKMDECISGVDGFDEDHHLFMMELEHVYGKKADELIAIVEKIPSLLCVTISFKNTSATLEEKEEGFQELLREGFCLALHEGAGIVIRQELPLRSQVVNKDGKAIWKQQNRIYGAFGGHGEWRWMSKTEMRDSYMKDSQTGEALSSDGITTYGNIKDFVKKANSRSQNHKGL